eukprot:scaffold91464_cov60-Phaeocystis_antarctica.AAC.1
MRRKEVVASARLRAYRRQGHQVSHFVPFILTNATIRPKGRHAAAKSHTSHRGIRHNHVHSYVHLSHATWQRQPLCPPSREDAHRPGGGRAA